MSWGLFWNQAEQNVELVQLAGYTDMMLKVQKIEEPLSPLLIGFSDAFEYYLKDVTKVDTDLYASLDLAIMEIIKHRNSSEPSNEHLAKAIFYLLADRPRLLSEMIHIIKNGWKPDKR